MDSARFLIAKYVPDVFRNEPRNIGVVLWSPHGIVARFAGENPDAPGEVDDTQIPSFVASTEAYKQWIRYWRREIAEAALRPMAGGAAVPRTAPGFVDVLGQTEPSNYILADGGMIFDPVPVEKLSQVVSQLYATCVALDYAGEHELESPKERSEEIRGESLGRESVSQPAELSGK